MNRQNLRVIISVIILLLLVGYFFLNKHQEKVADQYTYQAPPPAADARPVPVDPHKKRMGANSPGH